MSSNNKPLVTGLIPSYNHAKYIKESIQSMIDQDYENMEMIIDDKKVKVSAILEPHSYVILQEKDNQTLCRLDCIWCY